MSAAATVTLPGKLAQPRGLSPTAAGAWLQCELRYAFIFLAGWTEPATIAQFTGNVTHRAVEMLYGLKSAERSRATASELLRLALDEELSKLIYSNLRDLPGISKTVIASGEDALDGLFDLEEPSRITVDASGLEVWVNADLYGAPIRGRIDRLYDAHGAEVIADYKTGKVPPPAYTKKAFFGLWTYAAGLAAADPDHRLADRIELLYLTGRQRLTRPVLRSVALDHARNLAIVWRQILQAAESRQFAARRSRLCDWCPFKPACPAFGSGPAPGTPEHDARLEELDLRRRGNQGAGTAQDRYQSESEVEGTPHDYVHS